MAKKKGYDWKIGLKKFGIDAGIVILTGFIAVYSGEAGFLAVIPLAKAGLNWLKNRKK